MFCSRKPSRDRLKSRLVDRDGRRCFYCGDPNIPFSRLTLDHAWPRMLGGSNEIHNLVLACSPCNTKKGATISMKALRYLFQFTPCACRASTDPRLLGDVAAEVVRELPEPATPRPVRQVRRVPADQHPFVRRVLAAFPGAEIVADRSTKDQDR